MAVGWLWSACPHLLWESLPRPGHPGESPAPCPLCRGEPSRISCVSPASPIWQLASHSAGMCPLSDFPTTVSFRGFLCWPIHSFQEGLNVQALDTRFLKPEARPRPECTVMRKRAHPSFTCHRETSPLDSQVAVRREVRGDPIMQDPLLPGTSLCRRPAGDSSSGDLSAPCLLARPRARGGMGCVAEGSGSARPHRGLSPAASPLCLRVLLCEQDSAGVTVRPLRPVGLPRW